MSLRWFEKLSAEAPTAPSDGHWRKLPAHHKGKGPGGELQMGKTWVRKNRMKSFVKLYPHQADFVKAVENLPKGGGIMAAHGTGTGKTVSSLAAFESLKGQGKARRALVIAPAGIRDNYLKKGVEKFTDSKGVIVSSPSTPVGPEVEYIITSYAAFRRNPEAFLEIYKPDTIIADEFHRATNPGGKTHKALRQARSKVDYFMGLTASSVQNDPSDVAPLLDIVTAGKAEVGTKKQFKRRYVRKQRVAGERGVFGGKTYRKTMIRKEDLVQRIGPNIHYIEDLDADKKPTKETQTVEVSMSDDQVKLYKQAMKGVDPKIRAMIAAGQSVDQKEAMGIFARLMKARQVSNSLHTVDPKMTPEMAAELTPKIKRILDDADEHIKNVPDAQIIMFTNVVHGGVDVLTAGLDKRGVKYGVFSGKGNKGVTEATRQQAVEDYLSGKNKVIVITSAGAEGLSLGNTTMVQMVDGHYNPERMNQAEARGVRAKGLAHRPKEKRKVIARRYVSTLPKTFWQRIMFQEPERSVGQWVHTTAGRKEHVTKQMRQVMARRSEHERKRRKSTMYKVFGGGP